MKNLLFYFIFLFVACLCHGQTFAEYKDFIQASEGYRNKPYQCTAGVWTVGIGHTGKVNQNKYYSDTEINQLFEKDLQNAISDAKDLFPGFNTSPKALKLVLVSLSFNLGKTKLSKFVKFRAAINANDWETAAYELKNSKWFGQVGNRGPKYHKIIIQEKS